MIIPFYDDKSILELLLDRIEKHFGKKMRVIVATTTNGNDDILAKAASDAGADVFRGDESDVLGRFIAAARHYGVTNIVRVCADNPFLDMPGINTLIDCMDNDEGVDYVTFAKSDGTPAMKTHYGFWAEAVRLRTLEKVASMTDDKLYHEHVTNFIYSTPGQFRIRFIAIPPVLDANDRLRLTIDTREDFDMLGKIYAKVASTAPISIKAVMDAVEATEGCYETMEKLIKSNSK